MLAFGQMSRRALSRPDQTWPDAFSAVLLDRDGTLNVKAPDGQYVTSPEQLALLDHAAEAVAAINAASIPVALVTNQRGVARGVMSPADLEQVHARLATLLRAHGAHLDEVIVCPHAAESCSCRKPQPGMLTEALSRFGVEPAHAVMVGDADSDVEAGRRAGTATVQIARGDHPSKADLVVGDLRAAVQMILSPRPRAGRAGV